MNLILLCDRDKIENEIYRLDDFRAVHIINVLRFKKDDQIKVGFVGGSKKLATILEADKNSIKLKLEQTIPDNIPSSNIDLIVALPRPQILKKVLFICGMMNVNKLHLIRSHRVEKSFYQSPLLKEDNIKKQLYDGMMQGENLNLCEVIIHERFKNFFQDHLTDKYDQNYLKLCADSRTVNSLDKFVKSSQNKLLVAIGPEGGWVDFEIELIQSIGFELFTLGAYNLRVEYAVNAAISQLTLLNLR